MVLDLFVAVRTMWVMGSAPVRERFGSERGATAAEYAFLVALIALAIIAGATALGLALNANLGDAGDKLSHL